MLAEGHIVAEVSSPNAVAFARQQAGGAIIFLGRGWDWCGSVMMVCSVSRQLSLTAIALVALFLQATVYRRLPFGDPGHVGLSKRKTAIHSRWMRRGR
jgi:hypothetical protein